MRTGKCTCHETQNKPLYIMHYAPTTRKVLSFETFGGNVINVRKRDVFIKSVYILTSYFLAVTIVDKQYASYSLNC